MAENPLSAKVNNQKGSSGISAAKGVDLTLSGPPSGYHVPLTMHGTERLQITPANSISSPCNNNKTTIFNINPSMHVHSLDSQTLESWVRTKGLPMMAQQIRTELTPFDRTIVKGDV